MSRFRRKAQRASVTGAPKVVVVGMGFAGLATVRGLTRAGLRVTLLDRNIYSTFQPLLYQVATGGLNPSDVASPLRAFAHGYGAHFIHGEPAQIGAPEKKIVLSNGDQLDYASLVLPPGAPPAY